MAPRYKSRGLRQSWTPEKLKLAMKMLEEGKSDRQVSIATGIARRTISRYHSKLDEQGAQISDIAVKKLGRKCVLTPEEQGLVERIVRLSKVGCPLTKKMIQSCVFEYLESNGTEHNLNNLTRKVGRDWFRLFMKRHPALSVRKAQKLNPARAQKLNRNIVSDYFEKLEQVMEELGVKHEPSKIFNLDEKGIQLNIHKQQHVLAEKGTDRVDMLGQEHGENVTVVPCVSAIRNAIPPFILFKGSRMKSSFKDGMPPATEVCMDPKGSMPNDLFVQWLEHFGKFKPPGRVLLILDGAKCHLSLQIAEKAESLDIQLFCLPSNTTHELQTLDKSVFRSVEHHWDATLMSYWNKFPERTLTKERFSDIFKPVWEKSLTIGNIVNGFRATGIYPFDKDILPEETYLPSEVTFCELETNQAEEETNDAEVVDDPPEQDIEDRVENGGQGRPSEQEHEVESAANQGQGKREHEEDTAADRGKENEDINRPGCSKDSEIVSPPQTSNPGCSKDITKVSPFQATLATPRLKRKKAIQRRKSINYKAQVLNKKLFQEEDAQKAKTKTTTNKIKNWVLKIRELRNLKLLQVLRRTKITRSPSALFV